MDIVRQIIMDDGGEGTVQECKVGEHGLGIFNTILNDQGKLDATWVFMPWEGVIAVSCSGSCEGLESGDSTFIRLWNGKDTVDAFRSSSTT